MTLARISQYRLVTNGGEICGLVVHCRDVGFDCEGECKAESEEELLKQVAEHASSAH